MLAQSIPDISSVPAEFIKSWWIMAAFAIAIGLLAYNTYLTKQSKTREISGSIETRPHTQHAEQSDLDALTATVNDMRIEITAQFRAAQQAGEGRVSAITQNIDEEIGSLANKLSTLASVLHEKIGSALVDNARQSAEISSLQATSFRHDAEVRAIQQAIADLIKSATKRRHES